LLNALPALPQLLSVINEHAPKVIPGQYIVVFKPETARVALQSRLCPTGSLGRREDGRET